MNVSFPVNGGNANVFPWIAADANGHVGIVWFGDDRTGNSNDRSTLEPGHPATQGAACNSGTTCMQDWAQWNVYYAESVNGHDAPPSFVQSVIRSEEHTSELQSHSDLVCRLLLEKKKKQRAGL